MIFLRSVLFNIYLFIWVLFIGVALSPSLFMPYGVFVCGRIWAVGILWGLRFFCGITHEVRGGENIPEHAAIIASKHQSAWETIAFFVIFKRPVFILKRELYFVPVINIYVFAMRAVAINRSKGAVAMKKIITDSVKVLKSGKSIVIYPEGTRMKPGAPANYKSGIAGIYKAANMKVVPVALNSGLFWGKNSFYKKPGKIIIEILPAIEPGLPKEEFMKTLQEKIETASLRLYKESSLSS